MNNFFKYSTIIAITVGLGYFLSIAKSFLLPLVIAIVIWYLIIAIAGGYESLFKKIPFGFALFFSLLTIFIILGFFGWIINNNIEEVVKAAPEYQIKFQDLAANISQKFSIIEMPSLEELQDKINISSLVGSIANMLASFASYTSAIFIYILLLLAIMIFAALVIFFKNHMTQNL